MKRLRLVAILTFAAIGIGALAACSCGALTADLGSVTDNVRRLYSNAAKTEDVPRGEHRKLREGDGITVDSLGYAKLSMGPCTMAIYRSSKLEVEGIPSDSAPICIVGFNSGSIYNSVETQTVINTDWAVITSLSTEFFVHVDQARGLIWVIVSDGRVRVDAGGASVILEADQQTWVKRGGPPQRPRPATREAVGDLFPPLDELTNGELEDPQLLQPSTTEDLPPDLTLDAQPRRVVPGQPVGIAAQATDDYGVVSIEILIDGKTARTCEGPACKYAAEFGQPGEHLISAIAVDTSGQRAEEELYVAVQPPGVTGIVSGNPFDDDRVVRALSEALAWAEVMKQAFPEEDLGLTTQRQDGTVLAFDLREVTYDPDEARKLLAEAGYSGSPLPMFIVTPAGDDGLRRLSGVIAEFTYQQYKGVIDLSLEAVSPDYVPTFVEQLNAEGYAVISFTR